MTPSTECLCINWMWRTSSRFITMLTCMPVEHFTRMVRSSPIYVRGEFPSNNKDLYTFECWGLVLFELLYLKKKSENNNYSLKMELFSMSFHISTTGQNCHLFPWKWKTRRNVQLERKYLILTIYVIYTHHIHHHQLISSCEINGD